MIHIEFYKRGGTIIAHSQAPAVPRAGEYVNINKEQWRVAYVAWALDRNPDRLRANVELEKVPNDEVGPR